LAVFMSSARPVVKLKMIARRLRCRTVASGIGRLWKVLRLALTCLGFGTRSHAGGGGSRGLIPAYVN
jgi:hypothetical protein